MNIQSSQVVNGRNEGYKFRVDVSSSSMSTGDDPLHHTKIVINGPFGTPARCMYSKCSLSSFNDPKAISNLNLLEQPSPQYIL